MFSIKVNFCKQDRVIILLIININTANLMKWFDVDDVIASTFIR